MTTSKTASQLQNRICKEFDVEPIGDGYAVYSPFTFDDGDSFVVMLHEQESGWSISDNGHTFMHLSYTDVDISKGQRAGVIDEAMDMHSITNRDGELVIDGIPHEMIGYRVLSYLHGIEKICGVTKFTKQRVQSTFVDDFATIVSSQVSESELIRDWHDVDSDPDGIYQADYRIEGTNTPCLVFAVSSDARCQQATIVSMRYYDRNWNSLVVFEDQTKINRRAIAQLSDAVGKQFSSLGDKKMINKYIVKMKAA